MRVRYGPLIDQARGRLGNLIFTTRGETGVVKPYVPPRLAPSLSFVRHQVMLARAQRLWNVDFIDAGSGHFRSSWDRAPDQRRNGRVSMERAFLSLDVTDAAVLRFRMIRVTPGQGLNDVQTNISSTNTTITARLTATQYPADYTRLDLFAWHWSEFEFEDPVNPVETGDLDAKTVQLVPPTPAAVTFDRLSGAQAIGLLAIGTRLQDGVPVVDYGLPHVTVVPAQ